jgi:hypothetical protein
MALGEQENIFQTQTLLFEGISLWNKPLNE